MGTLRKLRRTPSAQAAMRDARVKYLCPEHAPPGPYLQQWAHVLPGPFAKNCGVCGKRDLLCIGVRARDLRLFVKNMRLATAPKQPTEQQIKQARDFLRAHRPDMPREQVEAEAVKAATAYFCEGERE